MKKIRYMRHADKVDQIVVQAGLDEAQKSAPGGKYTDVFYGIFRTCQTILAVVCTLGVKANVHEPISELGDEEIFAKLTTPEFTALVKNGRTNLQALDESLSPEEIRWWEELAASAVVKMFNLMKDGGFALAAGHDPLISLAGRFFGWKRPRSLRTLEWIDIIQGDDGEIYFAGIVFRT